MVLNEAVEAVFGKKMKIVCDTCTVIFNFGTILGYMVFIQKSLNHVIDNHLILCILSQTWLFYNNNFIGVIITALFVPAALY